MGKTIPERWRDYTNIGCVVKGTRFLSFKVPLQPKILTQLPKKERWGIPDLIQAENLGLVVDLTYTDRYYDYKNITESGLRYVKIKTMGHAIPSKKVVDKFFKTVDVFMEEDEEKLIGVHCTHGLNRTGYLVCRYMIEKLGIDPDEAIQEFNNARGHQQERLNYISHLKLKGWEPNTTWKEETPKEKRNQTDRNWRRPESKEEPKFKRRSPDEHVGGFSRRNEQQPGPYHDNQFGPNYNNQFPVSRGNHQGHELDYQQGNQSDYQQGNQSDYQQGNQSDYQQGNQSDYQQGNQSDYQQGNQSDYQQGNQSDSYKLGYHFNQPEHPYQQNQHPPYEQEYESGYQGRHDSGYQGRHDSGYQQDQQSCFQRNQQREFHYQYSDGPHQGGARGGYNQQRRYQHAHPDGPHQEGSRDGYNQQREFGHPHPDGPYQGGSRGGYAGYDREREFQHQRNERTGDFTGDVTDSNYNFKTDRKGLFFNFGADLERKNKEQKEEIARRERRRGRSKNRGGSNQRFDKNFMDESSGRYKRKNIAMENLSIQDEQMKDKTVQQSTPSIESNPKKNPEENSPQDSPIESNLKQNTPFKNPPQQKPEIENLIPLNPMIDDKTQENPSVDNPSKQDIPGESNKEENCKLQ